MNRTISANLNRFSGLVYFILLGILFLTGARFSASNYFAQGAMRSGSSDEAATAIAFQSENPGAHEAFGVELLKRNEFASASEAFSRAVSLSPSNYRLWLRLASSQLLGGDVSSAESAYLRAIELAPAYSLPRMELGRMYLELGQREKAFEYLASAARLDQSQYAEVLKSANAAFGDDPDAIERAVAPVSIKGKSIVAWYFLDRSWMTEKTHEFLLSGEPNVDEKNTVIRFLKEKRNYTLARDVWLSRLATDGVSTSGMPIIIDGSFEAVTENDPSGLGWQIDWKISATSIALDRKDIPSGSVALKIRFAGNAELRRPVVAQIAFVEPGQHYTLQYAVRAGEIISAGLPVLLVSDPATNAILGRSEPIADTKGTWVRRSLTFKASDESAVLISFQRPDCTSEPCPIFGEVSIDDISLTPNRL